MGTPVTVSPTGLGGTSALGTLGAIGYANIYPSTVAGTGAVGAVTIWRSVNDGQTPTWVQIDDSQTPGWE
jgi:hypothetical protein